MERILDKTEVQKMKKASERYQLQKILMRLRRGELTSADCGLDELSKEDVIELFEKRLRDAQ